jgi:predicted transposase/invertase (TIGR01784 family)
MDKTQLNSSEVGTGKQSDQKRIFHPKRLHTPHDKLFKYLLKDVTIAQDFFEIHLPPTLKEQCDLSTLRISETSYIETAYQTQLSDILYQVNMTGGSGYLYCLIEHLSEGTVLTPFQVLKYQVSILQQHLSQLPTRDRRQAKLPLVMPLLFYRGEKSPYPYSTDILDCFQDPELARQVFLKPISLVDLSIIPDEELKTHRSVALLELIQKHIYTRDKLEYKFKEWVEKNRLHTYLTPTQFEMVIRYELALNCPQNLNEYLRVLEHIDIEREYKETMQTVAQHLRNEGHLAGLQLGRQEGRQEGLEKGLQKGRQEGMEKGISFEKYEIAKKMVLTGWDIATIHDITQLPNSEIQRLKEELI